MTRKKTKPTPLEQLIEASGEGTVSKVRELIKAGVDVNGLNKQKHSPLMAAAECARKSVIQLLLKNGADPNLKGKNRETALGFAVFRGDPTCVEVLLKAGADPDVRKKVLGVPFTLLNLAVAPGWVEIVQLLLKAGARVNEEYWGSVPITTAASNEKMKCMEVLMDAGANLDHQNNQGWTALMEAARHGKPEVAKFLLTNGASTNLQNRDGLTALSLAAAWGHGDIVHMLLDAGANTDLHGGSPPFNYPPAVVLAAENNHKEIALDLLRRKPRLTDEHKERVKKCFGGKFPRPR